VAGSTENRGLTCQRQRGAGHRWVVEACHSWLNRNRALLIRWSKKDDNHLALLQLACGLIAFKKARVAQPALHLPG
jgi:putative transposase